MKKMTYNRGRVTLPAESGCEQNIKELAKKWQADAVRDSDGTTLSEEILGMGMTVYSTLCLIREAQDWAADHPDQLQQLYLITPQVRAYSDHLQIPLLEHYFNEQFKIDTTHNTANWWEVRDRTISQIVPPDSWCLEDGSVTINNAVPGHLYTVSFLVYLIWEPISMYNHITNNWTEPHRLPLDPRLAGERIIEYLKEWLKNHPLTDVVRFTSFAYNFTLIYGREGKERFVDWFGYLNAVSPAAIEAFEKENGYRLCPEDFVAAGEYNNLFRNPSPKILDWMDLIQKFVTRFASQCVDITHRAGKKAIMFLGDHWIGAEPYGPYFSEIGLDGVVGAVSDGVTLRMLADIPDIHIREARFYPYFFTDVFHPGGDPIQEFNNVWVKSRRAIMRQPVDRIGFGGYLSLAARFPDFCERVTQVCREFREFHTRTRGTKPYAPSVTVAILNTWGHLRSWQCFQVAHSLWNRHTYSYLGILEALSGLPFKIIFLSFDEIRKNGIPEDVNLIINAGEAGSSWSGAEQWADTELCTLIRSWVLKGGGFIGVGEPSACNCKGRYLQLADLLGVEKEIGYTLGLNLHQFSTESNHFITLDLADRFDDGEGTPYIYPIDRNTMVLDQTERGVRLAVRNNVSGRCVYISGLPFSLQNTRLLARTILWAVKQECQMDIWTCSNPNTECARYPEVELTLVLNNTEEQQQTLIHRPGKKPLDIELTPYAYRWIED